MRQGHSFNVEESYVVPRQVLRAGKRDLCIHARSRYHRWLICFAFVIGVFGFPGFASAGPLIVDNEETGGGATLPSEFHNEYAAVRLFDEVFSQKKPDVCILLMAADAINHTPAGDFTGPAGFEQYVAETWIAFPDATFVIDAGSTGDDVVTLRWTMTGHHLEAFGEQAATGIPVQLEGVAILRFEQNMIAESWLQYDRMSLVEQISAIPAAPKICPPCREP